MQPDRLLCPWDSPGRDTVVGCHFLLQGIFLIQGSNPHLLYLLHSSRILYPISYQQPTPSPQKKKQPEHRMLSENRKDETLGKRVGLTMGRITHRRQGRCLQTEGNGGRIFHMISLLLRISTSSLVERSKPHWKQGDLIRSYFSNQEECAEGPGLRK